MKLPEPSHDKNSILWILYVAAVLALDLLVTHQIPWLHWSPLRGFDGYKFLFWLVIPLMLAAPHLDVHYFTFRRWKRADAIFFGVLAGGGLCALLLVSRIPQLAAIYPDQSHLPDSTKWMMVRGYLVWDVSWLPGWEFLHRYILLRAALSRWPRWGWVLVPISEGLYHLQKPPLEALGMVLFSVAATQWSLRRRNLLLPFFAHAAIELGLLVVLYT